MELSASSHFRSSKSDRFIFTNNVLRIILVGFFLSRRRDPNIHISLLTVFSVLVACYLLSSASELPENAKLIRRITIQKGQKA